MYRPVIAVVVTGSSGNATIYGLLDTGSDITLLPGGLKKTLGVGEKIGSASLRGAGGNVMAVDFHRMKLGLHDPVKSTEWFEWEATVGFLHGDGVAILEHLGFLVRLITRNGK